MTTTECVNVHPCPRPLCGSELCETHAPTCVYCSLHDQEGLPLPNDPHRYDSWPKPPLWQRLPDSLWFAGVRTVCVLVGHRWASYSVRGHAAGPILYYSRSCRRCAAMDRDTTPGDTGERD